MKKLFSAILAAALCFSLCACGIVDGNTESSDNGGNGGNTEVGGNTESSGNTESGGTEGQKVVLTEDTDFSALVSDKVTAKEWDAAFTNEAFAGCTSHLIRERQGFQLECKNKFGYQKTDAGYDISFESYLLYAAELDPQLFDGEWKKAAEMMYRIVGKNATYTGVQFDFESGDSADVDHQTYDLSDEKNKVEREWSCTFRDLIAYDFAGQFEKFSYDETLHAYTYEGESLVVPYSPMEAMRPEGYTITSAIVKIVGGKLAYTKVETSGSSVEDPEEYFYYDYGKTEVAIPTDATPAE